MESDVIYFSEHSVCIVQTKSTHILSIKVSGIGMEFDTVGTHKPSQTLNLIGQCTPLHVHT